jgi:hypothetical protein
MGEAQKLGDRARYRLIELLDPEITHYEFFLARPPLVKMDWKNDQALLAAIPEVSLCLQGWPSQHLFDYNYQLVTLSEDEFEFMKGCDANCQEGEGTKTVGEILAGGKLDLEGVRSLQKRQLILLSPDKRPAG